MAVSATWLIAKMESWAPPQLAEDWDNVGLLVGDAAQTVHKVLVALDVNQAVLHEAAEGGFDWIITHHPLIFRPLHRITMQDPVGQKILFLAHHHIGLYSAHTNLDIANGGVNDILFDKLALCKKENLLKMPQEGNTGLQDKTPRIYALGRVGYLPEPMTLSALAAQLKAQLSLSHIYFAGAPDTLIHKVGLCAGDASGMRYFQAALQKDCDVYITGDLRYHQVQAALEMGLTLIDATHYATEAPLIEAVVGRLRWEALQDGITLTIQATTHNGQVFQDA